MPALTDLAEIANLLGIPFRGVVRGMNGNICRCGTYYRIITAIEQAAKVLKGGGK